MLNCTTNRNLSNSNSVLSFLDYVWPTCTHNFELFTVHGIRTHFNSHETRVLLKARESLRDIDSDSACCSMQLTLIVFFCSSSPQGISAASRQICPTANMFFCGLLAQISWNACNIKIPKHAVVPFSLFHVRSSKICWSMGIQGNAWLLPFV